MDNALSAVDALQKIRSGTLSSVDLVKSCLARIEETEDQLKAWVHLDPEYALAQAKKLDMIRQSGRPLGKLHGLPVGIKDIFDTLDFPTERGTSIFANRQPEADCNIAERLKEEGAIILGKTVTTEFAFMHPAQTRNPYNIEYSPGGSSSGSAAAVAAFNVPLAIGTQTNGSVIRPASFCGVFGFKPTRGVISRRGVLQTSITLDQVGVFGRTLEDVGLLADVIGGYDATDPASYPRPRPHMQKGSCSSVPVKPDLVWFDLPFNERLMKDAREGFDQVLELLGDRVEKMPSPAAFAGLVEVHKTIHEYEICQHLDIEFTANWDQISSSLQPAVERGRKISHAQYEDALGTMGIAIDYFDEFFKDFDAIIAPSAAGEAPKFCTGTGDPVFCTLWTLCGLPSLSLPVAVGETGLPIGVQIIGATEEDDRLLRTANWVLAELQSGG